MASHGAPRLATRQQRSAEARQKELQEIDEYKSLVQYVNEKVGEKDFSPELLEKTTALLTKNPEYYTIWNIRRRIYGAEFQSLLHQSQNGQLSSESKNAQISQILHMDLEFLFALLLKFPKCYWIWNHRLWLLDSASRLLPIEQARKIWENELGLVGKMLSRDSRNFHGWGYRRIVVQNLESTELNGQSMARSEYDYTTKMIGSNLSNFSAWHNRSKLILRILDEENATEIERRKMLDEEIALIHKALFDPYDQSLWFYHSNLMANFDPDTCDKSMAPQLSNEDRLDYVAKEQAFIEEMLEDADDCKWVYQALVESALIEGKLKEGLSAHAKSKVQARLRTLQKLDPHRTGRWTDMETQLQ